MLKYYIKRLFQLLSYV